jgi:hypothetical protein
MHISKSLSIKPDFNKISRQSGVRINCGQRQSEDTQVLPRAKDRSDNITRHTVWSRFNVDAHWENADLRLKIEKTKKATEEERRAQKDCRARALSAGFRWALRGGV